jgi:hypothetical protein
MGARRESFLWTAVLLCLWLIIVLTVLAGCVEPLSVNLTTQPTAPESVVAQSSLGLGHGQYVQGETVLAVPYGAGPHWTNVGSGSAHIEAYQSVLDDWLIHNPDKRIDTVAPVSVGTNGINATTHLIVIWEWR